MGRWKHRQEGINTGFEDHVSNRVELKDGFFESVRERNKKITTMPAVRIERCTWEVAEGAKKANTEKQFKLLWNKPAVMCTE